MWLIHQQAALPATNIKERWPEPLQIMRAQKTSWIFTIFLLMFGVFTTQMLKGFWKQGPTSASGWQCSPSTEDWESQNPWKLLAVGVCSQRSALASWATPAACGADARAWSLDHKWLTPPFCPADAETWFFVSILAQPPYLAQPEAI